MTRRYYIHARCEDGPVYYSGHSWEYSRTYVVRKLRRTEAAELVARLRAAQGSNSPIHSGLFQIRMFAWPKPARNRFRKEASA